VNVLYLCFFFQLVFQLLFPFPLFVLAFLFCAYVWSPPQFCKAKLFRVFPLRFFSFFRLSSGFVELACQALARLRFKISPVRSRFLSAVTKGQSFVAFLRFIFRAFSQEPCLELPASASSSTRSLGF